MRDTEKVLENDDELPEIEPHTLHVALLATLPRDDGRCQTVSDYIFSGFVHRLDNDTRVTLVEEWIDANAAFLMNANNTLMLYIDDEFALPTGRHSLIPLLVAFLNTFDLYPLNCVVTLMHWDAETETYDSQEWN
tara:strand:- start:41465 stop:41869 length:405 start_codon:yes stop_codon:yes gene_type:complete